MKNMNWIHQLRWLALLEGISYLLLFGLGMPLKYWADIPGPNYVIGLAHGILFVAYLIWVLIVGRKYSWSFLTFFWSGLASLLPFGTFVADAKIFKPLSSNITRDQ